MKTNKILLCLLLALPTVLFTSCLKDQDDVFDKSSSIRMDEYLTAVRDTLMSAPNGWAFDYYPSPTQQYGGRAYLLSFDKNNVTARYEMYPDDDAETTSYMLKSDMGPILSFDTYSNFLHADATPSQGAYEGNEGDFEFVVDSLGSGLIKLHSKRNGNTLYLHKLSVSQDEYMEGLLMNYGAFSPIEFVLDVNGQKYSFNAEDHTNRELQIADALGNEVAVTHYTFTDKGIRLYEPITLNGVQVWDLAYDDANLKLSAPGVETASFSIDPSVASGLMGNISTGNNAFQHTYTIPHLDQYTISTDQDWIHTSVNGDELTVTLDANADITNPRFGSITFTSGGNSSTVSVTQLTLDNILGKYNLTYVDNEGAKGTFSTTIAKTAQEGVLTMTVNNYPYSADRTLKFNLLYMEDSKSLFLQSGVLAAGSSNGRYQLAPAFIWGEGNYASYGLDYVYALMSFGADANGNLTFSLLGDMYVEENGSISPFGGKAETFVIGAFGGDITRANYLGYYEMWESADMVKVGAAPAKADLSVSEAPLSVRPAGLKKMNTVLDLSRYNISKFVVAKNRNVKLDKK